MPGIRVHDAGIAVQHGQNRCSRSTGISVHDRPEYALDGEQVTVLDGMGTGGVFSASEPATDRQSEGFYPASSFPSDGAFVVRTTSLKEVEARLFDTGKSSSKVGGSKLAKWLEDYMQQHAMTINQLHERTALDSKTIKKILQGKRVRKVVREKLRSGLDVAASDVPAN